MNTKEKEIEKKGENIVSNVKQELKVKNQSGETTKTLHSQWLRR